MPRDRKPTRRAQLEAEGWQRMTTYDEPRLSELVESYQGLGYEVHREPIHLDEEPECLSCVAEAPQKYHTIYIRKLPEE